MKISITDDEIRSALVNFISEKTTHVVDPMDCWFEVKAGVINSDQSVDDIHDVVFCAEVSI